MQAVLLALMQKQSERSQISVFLCMAMTWVVLVSIKVFELTCKEEIKKFASLRDANFLIANGAPQKLCDYMYNQLMRLDCFSIVEFCIVDNNLLLNFSKLDKAAWYYANAVLQQSCFFDDSAFEQS